MTKKIRALEPTYPSFTSVMTRLESIPRTLPPLELPTKCPRLPRRYHPYAHAHRLSRPTRYLNRKTRLVTIHDSENAIASMSISTDTNHSTLVVDGAVASSAAAASSQPCLHSIEITKSSHSSIFEMDFDDAELAEQYGMSVKTSRWLIIKEIFASFFAHLRRIFNQDFL